MNKLILLFFIAALTSGCTTQSPNNADDQRARANKAHGELSSEVRK